MGTFAPMKKHHRYSLQTRIAFALGIEREFVLLSELEKIPYSTRAWLRRQNVEDLIELEPQASHQILSEIRSGMLHLNTQLTDTYAVTYRLIKSLRRTLGERGYQKLLFEMRNDLNYLT